MELDWLCTCKGCQQDGLRQRRKFLHVQDADPVPAAHRAVRRLADGACGLGGASRRVRANLAAQLPGELQTDLRQVWDHSP